MPALSRTAPFMPYALAVLCFASAPAVAGDDWLKVDEDDGVTIWELQVPGKQVPGFRGAAEIRATPQAILAVIERVDEHTEWMHRCGEARLVEQQSPERAVVYNLTDTPWPVWDRDVVLNTRIERGDDGRITLRFENGNSKAVSVPDRTVRMPRLVGF